jgi:hypothetical protein
MLDSISPKKELNEIGSAHSGCLRTTKSALLIETGCIRHPSECAFAIREIVPINKLEKMGKKL